MRCHCDNCRAYSPRKRHSYHGHAGRAFRHRWANGGAMAALLEAWDECCEVAWDVEVSLACRCDARGGPCGCPPAPKPTLAAPYSMLDAVRQRYGMEASS